MTNQQHVPSPVPPTENGWFFSKLSGDYKEIGYNHGYEHSYVIGKIIDRMRSYTYWSTGVTWEYLRDYAHYLWWKKIPVEYQDEIRGIAEGVNARISQGVTPADVFFWNAFVEVAWYLWPTYKNELLKMKKVSYPKNAQAPDMCSAFIATGEYTEKGTIVMAHNSFAPYEIAYMNLILDIEISKTGDRFAMQTSPGLISSSTDFGVNNHGIMITETTIGGFENYCSEGIPEFIRARMAMECSKDFDDFYKLMTEGNTGGYANTWLVGDRKNNSIMRLELGLEFTPKTIMKDNGCFIGFNAPIDPRVRNLECSNTGYMDIRRHQGARQVRLYQLTEKVHKGTINLDTAKQILSDHFDVYTNSENPCSRTVDGHYELDNREYMSQIGRPLPFQPQGAVDAKVMDADMVENLNFDIKWGGSSDIGFNAEEFLKEHPQFNDLKPYLDDRPVEEWTTVAQLRETIGSKHQ